MKSSIKIDFVDNGKGLEPVIKVVLVDTDDTRDSLLKTFFQELQGLSSWLKVDFHTGEEPTISKYITIYPVKPVDLKRESELMLERFDASGRSRYDVSL